MRILVSAIVLFALSYVCAGAIKKTPWVFYALALVVCGLCGAVLFMGYGSTNSAIAAFAKYMQRGTAGFALITVVMFIGVMADSSKLRHRLGPIRQQLSLIGCILFIPHVAYYASSYLASNVLSRGDNVTVSLIFALFLAAFGVVLFVTSFALVKRAMGAVAWKRVQRTAYVFYGLTFVHLALFLVPSALAGRLESQVNLAAYALIALLYLVLRVRRYLIDREAASRETSA